MCELLEKLQSIKAESLLITDQSNRFARTMPGVAQAPLTIPATLTGKGISPEELYTPVPYIIPAQLFAATLAEVKRLDPDQPRTLSKVTRTI